MSSRNATSWMWAEALGFLEQAERMQRQFFRLSAPARAHAVWEPPVDVFEDEREIVIVVALPGVPADGVEVAIEAGALVVRAERRPLFARVKSAVRQLEIPYGYFERRIPLPRASLESAAREFRDGCLILRLGKAERI